jgi:hypothetical protein
MSFDLGTGVSAINTILAEEANRIGQDIYKNTVHVSPWLDLTKQTKFADGAGYQQTTLVYDRALPTTDTAGNTQGVSWTEVGTLSTGGNQFNTSLTGADAQPLDDAADDVQGARGTGSTDNRSFVQFGKKLKKYSLKRAVIESPRIALEDLRFAAHRQEQLRAIMDVLTQSTRNTWEDRYRDEYELNCANLTCCLAAGSVTRQTVDSDGDGTSDDTYEGNSLFNGTFDLSSSGASDADIEPDANISNAVMDKIYFQMIRKGAGTNAYGRENGRPVFSVVMSSEASYFLMTESGFRDDVRYNNSRVSELIAPLGVEKSFRGFYHLVDDLAPRFTASSGVLTRVEPYVTSSGVTVPNSAYETASFEAAFVLHPEVVEAQIPDPMSGGNGVTFNPVNYRGKFDWKNILNEITNPDGTIGFFRGVLASATKPIKTDFGYVVLFKRDTSTPAT